MHLIMLRKSGNLHIRYIIFTAMIIFVLTYFQFQKGVGFLAQTAAACGYQSEKSFCESKAGCRSAAEEEMLLARDIDMNTPLDSETSFWVVKYAKQFDLEPSIILAMIDAESGFNRYSVGESQDRGYLQIIPSTEKMLADNFGYKIGISYDPDKIFEPKYNIGLGVCYISFLKEYYGNNYHRILSEYNRGFYNLKKYYEVYKTYETAYSKKILEKEKEYEKYNRIGI